MIEWLKKELEQLMSVQGHKIGLKSKRKGTIRGSCNSQSIKGDAATFYQLASTMNSKAAADDGIPNFQISKGQLKRWLGNIKGNN